MICAYKEEVKKENSRRCQVMTRSVLKRISNWNGFLPNFGQQDNSFSGAFDTRPGADLPHGAPVSCGYS